MFNQIKTIMINQKKISVEIKMIVRSLAPLAMMMLLLLLPLAGEANNLTQIIKGKIQLEGFRELPGVFVGLPDAKSVRGGSSNYTQTNHLGNFTLEVPANTKVLLIKYLGFEEQLVEIPVNNNLNVTLNRDLTYKLEKLIVHSEVVKKQDGKYLEGNVLNNNKYPLSGISITTDGAKTATWGDGSFSLKIPEGVGKVIFSFLGFEPFFKEIE
jgi:hypothetical protein